MKVLDLLDLLKLNQRLALVEEHKDFENQTVFCGELKDLKKVENLKRFVVSGLRTLDTFLIVYMMFIDSNGGDL